MGLYIGSTKVSPSLIDKISSGAEVKEYIGGTDSGPTVDLRTLLTNDNPEVFTAVNIFKYSNNSSFSTIKFFQTTKFVKMTTYTNEGHNFIVYQSPDYRTWSTVSGIEFDNTMKDIQHNIILTFDTTDNKISFSYNPLSDYAQENDILVYKNGRYIPQTPSGSYNPNGPYSNELLVNINFFWGNGNATETIHFIADTNNSCWYPVYKTLYDGNNSESKTLKFECNGSLGQYGYSSTDFHVYDTNGREYTVYEIKDTIFGK